MSVAAALAALAPRWCLLRSGAADGATNMATDAALLAHARRTGIATLRLYGWTPRTLSLGRNERARDRFDVAALATHGVGVVRRPTGGRALFHDREVTYSVTAPDTLSLADSYAAINALLLHALERVGVRARPAARTGRALRPEGAACFAEPAAGELVVDGAKLVGSAQLREGGALLQHGSILIADDQGLIERLRRAPPPSAAAESVSRDRDARTIGAATMERVLGRSVTPVEVEDALASALADSVPSEPFDGALLQPDLARLVTAFADPEWTWRR